MTDHGSRDTEQRKRRRISLFTGIRPKNTDREWERFGRDEPYYGVIVRPEYKRRVGGDEDRKQFFQSGADDLENVLQAIRAHGIVFAPRRSLDFGCGVGRVLIPLARVSRETTGVDVSPAMCEEARANCARFGVKSVRVLVSDDDLSQLDGSFDFIHSYIVFQHIPPRRGLRILGRLVDRLAVGGIAAIHVTLEWRTSRLRRGIHAARANVPLLNGVANTMRGLSFGHPFMRMFQYELDACLDVIESRGIRDHWHTPTIHGSHHGVMIYAVRHG